MKNITSINCLAITHPHIAKQWHPTKNFPLTPFDVTAGMAKNIWWKCDKSDDHEWQASLNNRSKGRGCPCCSGQKVVLSNCLATTHPNLIKEWHPTKNLPITHFDVVAGSGKKIWWKCSVVDDHEWKATINTRIKGHGCACCWGNVVVLSTCLATTHPDLSNQWHPTKNFPLTPFDVSFGSSQNIWWKCHKSDDHEWKATLNSRSRNYNKSKENGCPCCNGKKVVLSNCLATTHPILIKQWHPTKNISLTPFDVTSGSDKKVWWKCDVADDHEWKATISSRVNNIGCPCCSGHKVVLSNCLASIHPNIAKQWHPTKNLIKPTEITSANGKKVWWKCDVADDHEWESSVANRVIGGNNCPCCSRQKVVLSNCLATTHPNLIKEWHPTKNLPITPFDVVAGSGKKIWWKCSVVDDHEWQSAISSRAYGCGCRFCMQSKGEKEIANILSIMDISYNQQVKFYGCKDKRKLIFDFYLPKYNAIIEYDGLQHFEPIKHFGGIKKFNQLRKRDTIKNEFATINSISLIRIPYNKFNTIEEEIRSFITSLNNIKK